VIDPNNLPRSSIRAGVDRAHLVRLAGVVVALAVIVAIVAFVVVLIA